MKASKQVKVTVPEKIIPAVTEEVITWELTKDEAMVLATLLGACSGRTSSLYSQLTSAGIDSLSSPYGVVKGVGPLTAIRVVDRNGSDL